MKAGNRHILLFIGNCTAHVSILLATSIIFFPPNCTSKLQPADRGIIQNLKVHHRLVAILGEEKPVKAIDLKDVVFMIAKAWDNVSQNTIKSC